MHLCTGVDVLVPHAWVTVACALWCADVVISFVKKTVVGVAGLLRLRGPRPGHYEEAQVGAHILI